MRSSFSYLNYYYKFGKASFAVKSCFDTSPGGWPGRPGWVSRVEKRDRERFITSRLWYNITINTVDENSDNRANSAQVQMNLPTRADLGNINLREGDREIYYIQTLV